jgi:dTDP-4-dehydrorhamnose reductase
MKKTILITGANGMLGTEAKIFFANSGYDVIAVGKDDLNITDSKAVNNFFSKNNFDFVLHCASYTKVDDAESKKEQAFLVNEEGSKNVAAASAAKDVVMIYVSTDYVFDGEKGAPYLTTDKPNPINVYGASKLAGEIVTAKENQKHYIVRTSWLYGKYGKNFVSTMVELSKTRDQIKVVNDQFGCPTWTYDLVCAIKNLVEEKKPFGIYHLCNSEVATWYDFTKKIFEILNIKTEVLPVPTSEFPRPARRPKFSAMDNGGLMIGWEEGCRKFLISNKVI